VDHQEENRGKRMRSEIELAEMAATIVIGIGIATGIRDEIKTVLHQANLTLKQILKVGFYPPFSILTETSKLTKIRSKLN